MLIQIKLELPDRWVYDFVFKAMLRASETNVRELRARAASEASANGSSPSEELRKCIDEMSHEICGSDGAFNNFCLSWAEIVCEEVDKDRDCLYDAALEGLLADEAYYLKPQNLLTIAMDSVIFSRLAEAVDSDSKSAGAKNKGRGGPSGRALKNRKSAKRKSPSVGKTGPAVKRADGKKRNRSL